MLSTAAVDDRLDTVLSTMPYTSGAAKPTRYTNATLLRKRPKSNDWTADLLSEVGAGYVIEIYCSKLDAQIAGQWQEQY